MSTACQCQSCLRLEAQQAAVRAFVTDSTQLLTEYVEIESEKKKRSRPLAAITAARAVEATLLIAKLDRLYRNAKFVFDLHDHLAEFLAVLCL